MIIVIFDYVSDIILQMLSHNHQGVVIEFLLILFKNQTVEKNRLHFIQPDSHDFHINHFLAFVPQQRIIDQRHPLDSPTQISLVELVVGFSRGGLQIFTNQTKYIYGGFYTALKSRHTCFRVVIHLHLPTYNWEEYSFQLRFTSFYIRDDIKVPQKSRGDQIPATSRRTHATDQLSVYYLHECSIISIPSFLVHKLS